MRTLEQQLQDEKDLRAIDGSRMAARHRAFLEGTLRLVLTDALTALSIERPDVARERIDLALNLMRQQADG